MRDLVETVIAEVMRHDPPPQRAASSPAPRRDTGRFARALEVARGQRDQPAPKASSDAAPNTKAADAPDPRHPDWRLWKASRAFEAMLVQQMLDAMRQTVPHSRLLHAGFAEDVQGSMFDQAVAQAVTRQGGLGIAEAIYRQVGRARGDAAQDSASHADNGETAATLLRARRGG